MVRGPESIINKEQWICRYFNLACGFPARAGHEQQSCTNSFSVQVFASGAGQGGEREDKRKTKMTQSVRRHWTRKAVEELTPKRRPRGMINIQKSETLLQTGKTNCHFQVGMTLELIEFNYYKEVLSLVVEKCRNGWQVKGLVGQGSAQCMSSFGSARREWKDTSQSNLMPLAVGASQQALAYPSR